MSRPEAFASDNERLEGTLIISPYVVTIAPFSAALTAASISPCVVTQTGHPGPETT
ncbi:MAG: hypothetical protein AN188_00310 [Candidatus Methanofastidiosum methylothiophilum]|uniref:Uncharacterized protein n=1 Tax=Candidatus Methanofastidiosum methylothiophilum TaxID=1705564 RepID=A0A150JEI3_9EURY|nr:MAG: hypothetical protein AN188_00310 [Candidatus Methanofastidiosum methylthiophilus]